MTYDYINIVKDLSIFFNGGALKTLGERTQPRGVFSAPDLKRDTPGKMSQPM